MQESTEQDVVDHGVADPGPDPGPDLSRSGETNRAEQLARIGVLLGAQRVEIYERSSTQVAGQRDDIEYRLGGWWAALLTDTAPLFDPVHSVPARWFPWSMGNLRPTEYMLVENAGALPIHPSSDQTLGGLGMSSSLHVPVRGLHGELLGAACVYWSQPTDTWPEEVTPQVSELARSTLDPRVG